MSLPLACLFLVAADFNGAGAIINTLLNKTVGTVDKAVKGTIESAVQGALEVPAAAGAVAKDLINTVPEVVAKEINAVKSPVLETALSIASYKCDLVKKLLGVDFNQMNNKDNEPDLNKLSLRYITKTVNMSVNINEAARVLPKTPHFNSEHFIIYAHGFTEDPVNNQGFTAVNAGFIKRGMYNILALDSSPLIGWFYLRSTTYVRIIGEKLGSILAQLVKDGLPARSIHLVGFSLGAHIVGFTGKQFHKLTGRRVARITGLDPAGPCFSQLDSEHRLRAGDADLVDVIHTDSGVFGVRDPIGDIDFYPNAGSQQFGCILSTCHHGRSWEFFADSLHDQYAYPAMRCRSWDEFKMDQCDDCSYMGIGCRADIKGMFYLQTGGTHPYGLGVNGTFYTNKDAILKDVVDGLTKPLRPK